MSATPLLRINSPTIAMIFGALNLVIDGEGDCYSSVNGGDPPALPGRHPEFDSSGNGMRNSQS